jgi:hypothetical protein
MVTPRVSEETKERSLSAEDLLRRYSRGLRGELIRGVFCETMAAHHSTNLRVGGLLIRESWARIPALPG